MNCNTEFSQKELEELDKGDFSEEIPASEGSVVLHLLGQLRFGMSLSRVTLPTFILEPRSTIQRLTDWMVHADILRSMNKEEDPVNRCVIMCTWLVSGFHMGPRTPKKPFNSLLGEVCRAVLRDADGKTIGCYQAEQVSHHPPISAFHYYDRDGDICIWGHTEMRSKFLGNSIVAEMDHENTVVNLELISRGETYTFNLPNMYGRGIIVGRLAMEIAGEVRIECKQTGVKAKVIFDEKPMFRGMYNKLHGWVGVGDAKTVVLDGRWSAYLKVKDTRTNKVFVPFDVRSAVPLDVVYPEMSEQCEYESQYVWREVARYIKAKETGYATEHKLALEEKQRAERKYFEDNSIDWVLQLFHFDEETKRFVPNNLNLTVHDPSEEPLTMPPKPDVPINIQMAQKAGVTKSMTEVQEEAERKVQELIAGKKK